MNKTTEPAAPLAVRLDRRVMPHQAVRQAWILNWLKENFCADVLNCEFHDSYAKEFPMYKRRATNWGAQPVAQAMRDLRKLADCGQLVAGRIGLPSGNWEPGFPKWVVGYTLPRHNLQGEALPTTKQELKL